MTQPKQVIAAAKKHGISESEIGNVQAEVNRIDFQPIEDLINWDSGMVTWALGVIDALQGTPLWLLKFIDPKNAAVVAAFLQRVEDWIVAKRAEEPS